MRKDNQKLHETSLARKRLSRDECPEDGKLAELLRDEKGAGHDGCVSGAFCHLATRINPHEGNFPGLTLKSGCGIPSASPDTSSSLARLATRVAGTCRNLEPPTARLSGQQPPPFGQPQLNGHHSNTTPRPPQDHSRTSKHMGPRREEHDLSPKASLPRLPNAMMHGTVAEVRLPTTLRRESDGLDFVLARKFATVELQRTFMHLGCVRINYLPRTAHLLKQ